MKKICVLLLLAMIVTVKAEVNSGLEVFEKYYSTILKGKRVGLVTNPTGVNKNLETTVDLLYKNPNVNLVALFSPEHGIRGNVRAGEQVKGGKDAKTQLPVYTLYGGKDHKPSKESLSKIDVLIYDIQDVGSRAYTYIWHLAECMSACAAEGKEVVVFDRPNPLGATVVDGTVTEKKYLSFIGLYSIPRVYGMTVGELARYLNYEEKIKSELTIIPMQGYKRGMSWKKTGLPWIPTSPQIPDVNAAYCFAATGCIGETGIFNIGIGYTLPFQIVATPWINAEKSSQILNSLKLPGVKFRPIYFTPYFAAFAKSPLKGVQIHITKPNVFRPASTEIALLCHFRDYYPSYFRWKPAKFKIFDKAMGTQKIRKDIQSGKSLNSILKSLQKDLTKFNKKRLKYLIY